MKFFNYLFLALFLAVIGSCHVFAIDKQTLWNKLNFPGPLNQFLETRTIAMQNVGLVEEILFFSDMQSYSGNARFNCLQILKESGEKGKISQAHFFDICFRLYNQIANIAHPSRLNDSKIYIKGTVASFLGQKAFPVSQQFIGFSALTNSMFLAGLIKDKGVLSSLNLKITDAQAYFKNGANSQKQLSISKLQDAISETSLVNDSQITEDGRQILSQYCQNLIDKITHNISPIQKNLKIETIKPSANQNPEGQFIPLDQWKKMNGWK